MDIHCLKPLPQKPASLRKPGLALRGTGLFYAEWICLYMEGVEAEYPGSRSIVSMHGSGKNGGGKSH